MELPENKCRFSSPLGGPKGHDFSGREDKERVVAYFEVCDWDMWISGGSH
jgi:hypothetical protein